MVDEDCSYIQFMFDDAVISSMGDYKCKVDNRGRESGEYGELQGFFNCDSDNHEGCVFFLEQQRLDRRVGDG